MFSDSDLEALGLTFQLAAVTTLILLVIGTPLAWWLARTERRFKFLIEAVVAMPLMLPPTVLGFYLLIALGANGPIGQMMEWLGGSPPAFSFSGLVIGSVIYSMPFVVQPLQSAFSAVGARPLEVASTLGASPWDRFFSVAVPLAAPGFLTATVLGFAHTIGEFGVVLMIGGNIPGETKVVSIAIYDHVEGMDYSHAHWLSGALILMSFVMLAVVYSINKRFRMVQP